MIIFLVNLYISMYALILEYCTHDFQKGPQRLVISNYQNSVHII